MKTYKLGFPFFCLLFVVSLFSCAIIGQEEDEELCYLYKLKKTTYEGFFLYRYKDGKLSRTGSAGNSEDGTFRKVVDSFYTRTGDYEGIVVSSIPCTTDDGWRIYLTENVKIEDIIDFDPILEVWKPFDRSTRSTKELIEEGLEKNYKRVK